MTSEEFSNADLDDVLRRLALRHGHLVARAWPVLLVKAWLVDERDCYYPLFVEYPKSAFTQMQL